MSDFKKIYKMPKGFKAAGIHCGIRKNKSKRDLALIVSDSLCAAASVYTQNLVKGAPIAVTKKNISNGYAQAIICNSGNANTCNANGVEIAEGMCALVEQHTGVSAGDVIVASTGVIGQPLNLTPIKDGMEGLVKDLNGESTNAAEAIMTTDTFVKQAEESFSIKGKDCLITGIAKGSGMINPNMATLLVFIATDANISPAMLTAAVKDAADDSFNMVSVDGDTSTNDMVSVLANGQAGNAVIDGAGADYGIFYNALLKVMTALSKMIAKDGEGATKLLECTVTGAKTKEDAKKCAKSVISSSLFKAAMFAADANWGRVLCALGYAGADIDVNKVGLTFKSASGTLEVCQNGSGIDFSEEHAKKVLGESEIQILVTLEDEKESATAWGCDLTYDYVKINADYRT